MVAGVLQLGRGEESRRGGMRDGVAGFQHGLGRCLGWDTRDTGGTRVMNIQI